MNPEEFKRRLEIVQAGFRAKAPAKLAEIEALWLRVRREGSGDPAHAELMSALHTLIGSAPALGCDALGVAARELEMALKAALAQGRLPADGETAAIDRLVAALHTALDQAVP
jgi:HPt (histidine-containing phosphotransfer) domain-containing protein